MFPSSFSIAALIGAAAIRKQVATKLGLNVDKEELEEKSEEDRKDGTKRRLSFDRPEEFTVAEKKKCVNVNNEESLSLTHPKLDFSFRSSPFLEQLRFAKCFFKENQNLLQDKLTREEPPENIVEESKDLIPQKPKQIPRMSLASRQSSMSTDYKTQPSQNNNPNKQSIVNSNTKVLEKVNCVPLWSCQSFVIFFRSLLPKFYYRKI